MASGVERAKALLSEFSADLVVVQNVRPKDLASALLEMALTLAIKYDLTDSFLDEMHTAAEYLEEYEPS